MKRFKVFIDSRTTIEYASFYIYGLYEVFGFNNVKFSKKPFKTLDGFEHFLAFTIHENSECKKIIIDFTDSKRINQKALIWSDVYGKINITTDDLLSSSKLIAIGPSFGVQLFNLPQTLYYGLINFMKSFRDIKSKKRFLSSYKAQFKRPKYSDYTSKPSKTNYIFFMASLWKQERETNLFRANFIKSCLENPAIEFEGGFAPRKKNDIRGFDNLTTSDRIPMAFYLENLKRTRVVFNTPAVKGCHGWKLAEFLCLGKAILSTPLSRELPAQLKDNAGLRFTTGSQEDIGVKVKELLASNSLISELEINSKSYFDNYLAPNVVIERLLNFVTLG